MSESISLYAVKKEELKNAPESVRKFVKDYFEAKEIFGIPCFVAIFSDYRTEIDDSEYEEGLTERELNNCGVFTWMSDHPEVFFEYTWS